MLISILQLIICISQVLNMAPALPITFTPLSQSYLQFLLSLVLHFIFVIRPAQLSLCLFKLESHQPNLYLRYLVHQCRGALNTIQPHNYFTPEFRRALSEE